MAEQRHFDEGGTEYARRRPTYPPQLAAALADQCPQTLHALDVGCGTGQMSVLLAGHFERVTATDPSASQIANAGLRDNIRYACETAERIGLADSSVDLIVAAQAAHWFDLDAFYAVARRVARPGAILALISYGVPQIQGDVGAEFDRFYWQDIHAYWPADRRHVEEGYANLPFPFPRRHLAPLVIERLWNFDELAGYIGTWSAVTRAEKAGAGIVAEQALSRLGQVWGDPVIRRPIAWPINSLLTVLD